MNEPFLIAIGDQEFKARFERWGYTHRIAVLIGDTVFTFEPDEKGGYRVLSDTRSENAPVSLLRAISEKLARLSNG